MAGAIVNPRVLNIAKPNARLRARQRIIRARMGNVTPPPIVARPAPAETPTLSAPDSEDQPLDDPASTEPESQPDLQSEPDLEPSPAAPDPAPLAPIAPVAPSAPPDTPGNP
jgi:hypothetical protein